MKLFAQIVCFFKNALVGMLAKAKVKPRRVAVVDLLRPDGFLCFAMDCAKITRFRGRASKYAPPNPTHNSVVSSH